jgi:hypothetical protein
MATVTIKLGYFEMWSFLRNLEKRWREIRASDVSPSQSGEVIGFDLVCETVSRHRRRFYHSKPYTLNRLFRKHMNTVGDMSKLPVLSAENTVITLETRPKKEWAKYAGMNKSAKYDRGGRIVMFRFRGAERLLDGNHRCRLWADTQDPSPHTAIVMTITQDYAE